MKNASLPLKLFCSYAHEDEDIMDELRSHLAGLRYQNFIEDWHDRQIPPGGDWDEEIKQQLEEADIVLLLISSDFIDSHYCMDVETARALQREKGGMVTVIPVFARTCVIKGLPFSRLQGTPKDSNWIAQQQDKDKDTLYSEVVESISEAIRLRSGNDEVSNDILPNATESSAKTNTISNGKSKYFVLMATLALISVVGFLYFKPVQVLDNPWDELLLQGEYSQANKLCTAELKKNSKSEPVKNCLSITGLMMDDYSTELFNAKAKTLLANNPDSFYVLAIMGEVLAAQKRWKQAENYYQQALKLNDQFSQAHYGLGQVYHLQKHMDKALIHYQKAIKLAPENRRFRQNLASLFAEQGEDDKAEQQLIALLAIDKSSLISYVELISALLNQGKFEQAFTINQTLLNDELMLPGIWNKSLNKVDWVIATDRHSVYLQNSDQKESYIKLQYAMTALLAERKKQAETVIETFLNRPVDDEIVYLIKYSINVLKQKHRQPEIIGRLDLMQSLFEEPAKTQAEKVKLANEPDRSDKGVGKDEAIQTPEVKPAKVPDISGQWTGKDDTQYFIEQFADGTFTIDSPRYGTGKGEFIPKMPGKFRMSMPGKGYGEYVVSSNGLIGWYGKKGTSQPQYETLRKSK